MEMSKSYESLVYTQKLALQSWKSAVARTIRRLDPAIEDLVWEVLLLCSDYLDSPSSELEDDIYKAAYELGQKVLQARDLKSVNEIYRDALLDSIYHHVPIDSDSAYRIVKFANILSDAFSQAYSDVLKRTIRHQRAEGLSNELRLAKRIQQHLLPKQIPQVPGFQFAGRLIPAAEIGGDYWSIKHYPDDGIITMKLADVTGHGIAAATLVAAVKFISGGQYKASESPSIVMEKTNHVLLKETPTEILVSMVYAWLQPDTREVSIVNAGHEPVLICRGEGCTTIAPTGPVMGVTETLYGEVRLVLQQGDILCFASDGITEAGAGEFFGMARLEAAVAELKDKTADEIADGVISRVTSFAGSPHDDMSILIVKVNEKSS